MANLPASFRAAAATAVALGALFLAAPPAAAQFVAPWGVWAGPPAAWAQDDEILDDRMIPPRAVGGILRSRGYRLVAAPRVSGDFIVAVGQNAGGRRMRFIIDGYSGGLVRASLIGRARPEIYAERPDIEQDRGFAPGGRIDRQVDGRPLAESELDARPIPQAGPHKKKAKPKPRIARRAAERTPMTHQAAPPTPAPSQATKAPTSPAPVVEPPKETATAPAPEDKTPLAPDARKPDAAPAAEPPKQAAVSPTPAEKPAPAPAAAAKPSDIGPRVESVAPQAQSSEAVVKPAEPTPSAPAGETSGSK